MGGLTKPKTKKSRKDKQADLIRWSVVVKENEDDDEWSSLNGLWPTKGKARAASAKVRDEYEERDVVKIRYSNLD